MPSEVPRSTFSAEHLDTGVEMLRWPEQQQQLEDLVLRGVPRLLLVAPGSPAPACTSCLEDWVRLPADDADLRARVGSLVAHSNVHARPTIDEFGILRRNGAFAIVPPGEHAIAQLLIADFGAVVRDEILERHVATDSNSPRTMLRTSLRKRLAPLGLTVSCVRKIGYMMHEDKRADPPPLAEIES
jgi:hypothetical protein